MKKISYFSYKGGSGRSSLVYNTIAVLAEKLGATSNEPIILLDLDIDSAGLTYLLCDPYYLDKKDENYYYIQDVVSGRIPGLTMNTNDVSLNNHPFFKNLLPVGNRLGLNGVDRNNSILFLPVKTGADIQMESNYDQADNNILTLARLCSKYHCKALVMDTPSGDQLTARWALETSTEVVTAMKITYQFRLGTFDFLRRKDNEYAEKRFIIVPNCVPTEDIYINGVLYDYNAVKKEINDKINNIVNHNNVCLEMLEDGCFGIPEVKRFKLQEGILYTLNNLTDEERVAYNMYKKMVDIVVGENNE